ncbi:unnamed protein product (macronuclear) [Paramecium tetraurelia]|uniref:EF-hand domain-containing protein n=1 Tax=Paramecium tetraurelia TaxID=5888 RepID=A0BVA5_PARTE|nr:uncharacterized protein GSPATT00005718001 [Paramecium tetraurelia]CAK62472.1 unnamed protein product [Paramecium tetraurelia]|eukprot:XP_001429870.1 hypothetical protein (macronuclear) [Paramecium tetraurelia strain d4-2]
MQRNKITKGLRLRLSVKQEVGLNQASSMILKNLIRCLQRVQRWLFLEQVNKMIQTNLTLSTRKTNVINDSSVTQSRSTHTEILKNSPVVQDLTKKIPVNMTKDKDDLYAETVYLKDMINKLTSENYDLKAKMRFLNKNTERMQTVVQNVGGYLQQKYVADKQDLALMTKLGISENLLTITLKKQIKELRTLIKQQNEEISNLKHDIKYTKIQELEKEINVFQEETLRLKTLLEQSQRNEQIIQMTHDFNQFEHKFYLQMQIINSLKQENSFYQGQITIEQEEKFKLQNHMETNQKLLNKQNQVIDDLQQTLKDKSTYIDGLQQELNSYKDINQNLISKANKLDNNQLRIIGLIKVEQELRKELQQKTRDIEYLDKTTTELKQKLNEKSSIEAKIKDQLQDELKKLKIAYEELDEKYKHLLLINAQSKLKETAPSIQQKQAQTAATVNLKTQRPLNQNNTPDSINQDKNQQQQKFKVIKKDDVDHLGFELNYRLRTKKITLADAIEKYLFDNKNKKTGEIKLKEISERMQKEPFLLIDEDSALLVARYLTEDNSQEFVVYNDQLNQSTTIVRSILQKLIGNYEILTIEIEIQKTKEITQVISKYKNSLKQYFDQLTSKYEGLLERKQIVETFEYMGIDLTHDQYDFLFLRLFSYSNNTQIFPYIRIFEIFQEIQIERIDSDKKKKSRKKEFKDQGDNKNKKVEIFTRRQSMELAN